MSVRRFSSDPLDKALIETNTGFFKKAIDKIAELAKKAVEQKIVSGLGLASTYIAEKLGLLPLIAEKAKAVWATIESWLSLISFP